MREFLVTKLVCSACGNNLQLTYDKPKGPSKWAEGEPTGAAMVEVRVAVEPCRTCLAPLDDVRRALKAIDGLRPQKCRD